MSHSLLSTVTFTSHTFVVGHIVSWRVHEGTLHILTSAGVEYAAHGDPAEIHEALLHALGTDRREVKP